MSHRDWYRRWFARRGLRDLRYQIDSLVELQEDKGVSVYAMSPSGGKTICSIAYLERYLLDHPRSRALVLAHGHRNLRTQYHEELKAMLPNFTFDCAESADEVRNSRAQVVVTLPQTASGVRRGFPRFNLLIVDEAHHWYHAKTVQRIIKKSRCTRQVLLTGTPSPFIYRGFDVIAVALNEIADEGMVSDPYVDLASSSYDLKFRDYSGDGEVSGSYKWKRQQTEGSLDEVLDEVRARLKTIMKRTSVYGTVKNVVGWAGALRAIGKTMFACHNQRQAQHVADYFRKKGVDVALSISDEDDGSEIERFKTDSNCKVLIVVYRGILGFNLPELECVVDMTCSSNIDRIYQLFCRVVRIHPRRKKKMFFKVVPHELEAWFEEGVMPAVLCLTDREYYTAYNGRNFLNEIPVFEPSKKRRDGGAGEPDPDADGGPKRERKKRKFKPYKGLPVIRFFKDILHKNHGPLNHYAWTTLREVRAKLSGLERWTEERVVESAARYNTLREWQDNDHGAYSWARRNGVYEKATAHMDKLRRFRTKEEVLASAKKYESFSEWRSHDYHSYRCARRHGWLPDATSHMKKTRRDRTKEEVLEIARSFRTRAEWLRENPAALSWALKQGQAFYRQCTSHLVTERPRRWTFEKCLNSSSHWGTLAEWRYADRKAYQAAWKNDWLEECTAHMK